MKLTCFAHCEFCGRNITFTAKIKLQLLEEWNQPKARHALL
jgi:hypothetical protein